jgi:prepilin-type N-terminal cleavage/methylation domain-containing protein
MLTKSLWATRRQEGFTIVELLIVIVIIAILATITIVAYNGVQNRANDAAVQSDIRKIGIAMHSYITLNGSLPTSEAALKTMLAASEINGKVTRGAYDITAPAYAAGSDTQSRNLLICESGGTTSTLKFGIGALSKSGSVFFYTSSGGLVKDTTPWVGQQGLECPKLGITVNDPSGYARTFGFGTDSTPAGWQTWTGP